MTPPREGGDPAERIIEKSMQYHLGATLPDGFTVMCLCDGSLFDGPVFHRRHVAAIAAQALRDGHVPTRPHEVESFHNPGSGWRP